MKLQHLTMMENWITAKYRLSSQSRSARQYTKVYLNNKLVIDTKDQTYKEGNFGLNVWDTTAFLMMLK
ncbi:hypothetical protein [Paenibacillus sp. F4]|uniref:hypothetical protein n=1 Tax=Paenibacillus sp. F4 TaxID=357385 RepID=UPI000C9F3532|nr:hypothetical protein [Paenibacillus sp. F4]PNQ80697.1 hypothetical protein C1T21_12960 [Paenibacillus sp. F4]